MNKVEQRCSRADYGLFSNQQAGPGGVQLAHGAKLDPIGVGHLAARALDFAAQRRIVLQRPVAYNGERGGASVLGGLSLNIGVERCYYFNTLTDPPVKIFKYFKYFKFALGSL